MTTRHLTAAVLGLALLTALGACGRKGDLELPPGADTAEVERPKPVYDVPDEDIPIDARPIDDEMNDISSGGMRNY